MVECLTDETVAAYVDGALALDEVGRVDHHIDGCVKCRAQLSTVAASPHSFIALHPMAAIVGSAPEVGEVVQEALAHGRAGDPLPQTALGRYVIDAVIGRGGMGVVVRAHDAELDRDVAIKLVAPSQRHGSWRVHVREEARVMAKLRHPNVVAVYDAGSIGDQLFIAMELVDGTSLARLRGRHRDLVLHACLDAGRGLLAAHAAGIVHGDVKPDNILVGTDGRAMIGDFGLARIGDRVRGGTPGYMAPELVRGEPATPASDQYALAVTVCEVITGERPSGHARPAAIPKWLWRALERGLAEDPAARFPTLQAFLDALVKPPRRRWVGMAAAIGVAAVVGVAFTRSHADTGAHATSSAARERCLHDRWTEHVELIRRIARGAEPNGLIALEAMQSPAACDVASGHPFLPRIEQQPAWLAAKHQLVAGMTSAALGHYTEAHDQLVPVFEVARRISDDAMIAQAGMVLGDVDVTLGKLDAAEKTFETALQGAAAANEDLGSAKILLRLAHLVGEARQQWDRGAELLRAASAAIVRAGKPPELEALLSISRGMLAEGRGDNAAAIGEYRHAVALRRIGHPIDLATSLQLLCGLEARIDAFALAKAHCEEALAITTGALRADHPLVAEAEVDLGMVAAIRHDFAEARRLWESALARLDRGASGDALGTATVLIDLGELALDTRDHAAATKYLTRLRTISGTAATSPENLDVQVRLAHLLRETRSPAAEVAELEALARKAEASLGLAHPTTAHALEDLAGAYYESHQMAEARATYAHAVEAAKALYGPRHLTTLAIEGRYGQALLELHDAATARPLLEQVAAILDDTVPADSAFRAEADTNLADCLLQLGQPARAAALAQQALAIREKRGDDPLQTSEVRFIYAKALGKDPRALALATQARDEMKAIGPRATTLPEVEVWLKRAGAR